MKAKLGKNEYQVTFAKTQEIFLPKELSFDGEYRKLGQFVRSFIEFMNSHKLSGKEGTPFLLSALMGRAAFFVRSLWKHDGITNSYELLNRLSVKFGSLTSLKPEVQMFMSVKQGYSESINDFVPRLWILAHKAFPEISYDVLSQEVLFSFCTGLYEPEAVRFMAFKQPENLSQAIEYYKEWADSLKNNWVESPCTDLSSLSDDMKRTEHRYVHSYSEQIKTGSAKYPRSSSYVVMTKSLENCDKRRQSTQRYKEDSQKNLFEVKGKETRVKKNKTRVLKNKFRVKKNKTRAKKKEPRVNKNKTRVNKMKGKWKKRKKKGQLGGYKTRV